MTTRRPRTRLARGGAALVSLLAASALASCQAGQPDPDPSVTPTTPADAATTVPAETVEIPATPVGTQVAWALEALDPASPATAEEAEARLAPAALAEISGRDLVAVFDQLATVGPWHAVGYEGGESQAVATIASADGAERYDLTVALDADGLIETLFFGVAYEHTAATSWDELRDAVEALPAPTTFTLVQTAGEPHREAFTVGELEDAPIGSVVKLYVLGAVVQAVADGDLGWEDTVTVTDELRSLPSGTLQDAPAGTTVTVAEAAQAMIEISDNTATDLLIEAVGREAVEEQLLLMGHHDPSLNVPLPTTRELFWLGWGDDGAYRERWAEADEAGRRELLQELPDGPPEIPAVLTDVVWPDHVDWFARADDLVAAHVALADRAATPAGAPLAAILSANPGLAPDQLTAFDAVAFKGGSSAGVLALTWRLTSGDATWVLTLQARSTDAADTMDVRPYVAAAGDAIALLSAGE